MQLAKIASRSRLRALDARRRTVGNSKRGRRTNIAALLPLCRLKRAFATRAASHLPSRRLKISWTTKDWAASPGRYRAAGISRPATRLRYWKLASGTVPTRSFSGTADTTSWTLQTRVVGICGRSVSTGRAVSTRSHSAVYKQKLSGIAELQINSRRNSSVGHGC